VEETLTWSLKSDSEVKDKHSRGKASVSRSRQQDGKFKKVHSSVSLASV
jgi:hypothetical protein